MTSAFLQSELASLIQDSKRKHVDVRSAAEKSLNDLKAISVTSESQLAADLLRRGQFIDPFVLACNSKQTKLAISGTICLQRLVASKAIPRGRLGDVLDAFQEASNQGYDVQLKILQALPPLLQLYASELQGDPLAKVLSICGALSGSKLSVVSSTAGATFQQLVTSVFERVVNRPGDTSTQDSWDEIASSDASKIFSDMCLVVRSEKPRFLRLQDLSLGLALEVVENCLSGDDAHILEHPDCMSICETHLIPGIAATLEKHNNYAIFGQCLRVSYLLAVNHLKNFSRSMSVIFDVILDWLDRGAPGAWRRILCLEFMRDICSDFDALLCLYANFDRKPGQTHVVQVLMSTLVRVAAEDPSLIGLGRQSTIPTNTQESLTDAASAMELSDFDAVGSVMQASSNVTGLSTKWSVPSTAFLEQTDRKQPPEMPETYVFTLVLASVAAFSDGLSKFIMPLSVPTRPSARSVTADENGDVVETSGRRNSVRGQKYQRLQNPLSRGDLPNYADVEHCAAMIENCWPAVLAICSTFLNSALDSHFYHILVRTVQKLAQVSGVMDLLTPRDALLTTLAKVSVPLNVSSLVSMLYGNKHAKRALHEAGEDNDDDNESVKSPTQSTPKPSIDLSRQNLNVRNLLCLRALLNLGIALGPSLSDASWSIIVQTLQQVEALMSVSPTARSAQGHSNSNPMTIDDEGQSNLSTEIASVTTASKRMFESTRTYTDLAFETFVNAIFRLVDDLIPDSKSSAPGATDEVTDRDHLSPQTITSKTARGTTVSVSSSTVLYVEADFTLKSMNDLSRINLHRFISRRSQSDSWHLIVERLLQLVSVYDIEPQLRLQAASIIDLISIEAMRNLEKQNLDSDNLDILQQACLQPLARQMKILYTGYGSQQDAIMTQIEMHRRLLDALENIVSHSGESLRQGWRTVFEVLQLTVVPKQSLKGSDRKTSHQMTREIMLRTLPPSFRTIQLVVSDFLRSIDSESLWVLVQLLPLFAMQQHDLNISLTTATLFWTINGLLLERIPKLDIPKPATSEVADGNHTDSHQHGEGSSLWFSALLHLAELCGDARVDVRNGAIRVLLKILDASGEQLTAEMWNFTIRKILLSPLKLYNTKVADDTDYQNSFSQLLAGTTELITTYSEVIVRASSFSTTWNEVVSVCRNMLERKIIKGHVAVFTSARTLVRALDSITSGRDELLHQLLRLWLYYHPADLQLAGESSSTEFAMHAELLQEIVKCNSSALESFASDKDDLKHLVKQSIKKTLLSAVPARYSDDTKKMTPEQEAVVTNLGLLARVMSEDKYEYSEFLQELIKEVLAAHAAVKSEGPASPPKVRPKPKYIAFMIKCIELLEERIPKTMSDDVWLMDIAAASTLNILAAVILTKYTNIPVNEAMPAWQKASTVATELFEAVSSRTRSLDLIHINSLAATVPKIAAAILNAPALETKTPLPSESTVTSDEKFDMACFARFHQAVSTILYRNKTTSLINECRAYTIVLFEASLIAKPWYGDLPADLNSNPLQGLHRLRPGSIRKPDFYVRKNIAYEALDALLGLVSRPKKEGDVDYSAEYSEGTHFSRVVLGRTAAPFVILRIAHTIKTFTADQKLRNLNPPPRPIQRELNLVLSKALELTCIDEVFENILPPSSSGHSNSNTDGKTHLRILYSLCLQLRELWERLPRIQVGAWQDDQDGRQIQDSLQKWIESVYGVWKSIDHIDT